MSLLHDSPDTVVAEQATHRFRAATIDAALAEARSELGPDVEILEANRIRRGGVGGFFAADLGVEIAIRRATGNAGGTVNGDDFDARLAFFDRVIDRPESPAVTGIERLLERATFADLQSHLGPAGVTANPSGSFAEHLSRQLAEHDTNHRLPRRVRQDDDSTVDVPVATTPGLGVPGTANPEGPTAHPGDMPLDPDVDAHAIVTPSERACGSGAGPVTPHLRPTTVVDQETETRNTETTVRASGSSQTPISSQPAERAPTATGLENLAASAIGRLVAELSGVVPVAGSRIGKLSRLTISVTAADGSVIEMSAELDGSRDG